MITQDRSENGNVMGMPAPAPKGLFLVFGAGQRPCIEDVERLLAAMPGESMLSISHRAEPDQGLAELLCRGLAFDLTGLAPALAVDLPPVMQGPGPAGAFVQTEAVGLLAGRHLEGGANLLPVLHTHLEVALALAKLSGVTRVMWGPSSAMLSVDSFARAVGGWLKGGAFPVPALVAMLEQEDGTLLSQGLSFFAPRILRMEAVDERFSALRTGIASALIGRLVDGDGHVPAWVGDQAGGVWNVAWAAETGVVTVRRGA